MDSDSRPGLRAFNFFLFATVALWTSQSYAGHGGPHSWIAAGGGLFSNSSNWNPSGAPASNDTAVLDLPGNYTVTFDADPVNVDLFVGDTGGDVNATFDLAGHTYTLHNTVTESIRVAGGGQLLAANLFVTGGLLQSQETIIGGVGGSFSQMKVSGADWQNQGNLGVGVVSLATVNLTGGGAVTTKTATLGAAPGQLFVGNGTINVNEIGADFNVQESIYIGGVSTHGAGSGRLNVGTGASVNVVDAMRIWANGNVTITGGELTSDVIEHGSGGVFDFSGGRLTVNQFNGDLANAGGTVVPGTSPGFTMISGSYIQSAQGTLEVEVTGLNPGIDHDQVIVGTSAILAGRLRVDLGGPSPIYGDKFTVLSYGSHSGKFDRYDGVFVDPDLTLAPIYNPSNLTLVAALPGDASLNDIVNFEDFALLSNNFGLLDTCWDQGNFNLDQVTNFEDFAILSNHFGQSAPSGAVGAAIPEPASWTMIGLAATMLIVRCGYLP